MGQMISILTEHTTLWLHAVLGLVLIGSSIALLILASVLKTPAVTVWAAAGLLAVLFSAYGGMKFFAMGQHNADSFMMAIGWLAAFCAYFAAFSSMAKHEASELG
jgi:hypothetical protein